MAVVIVYDYINLLSKHLLLERCHFCTTIAGTEMGWGDTCPVRQFCGKVPPFHKLKLQFCYFFVCVIKSAQLRYLI